MSNEKTNIILYFYMNHLQVFENSIDTFYVTNLGICGVGFIEEIDLSSFICTALVAVVCKTMANDSHYPLNSILCRHYLFFTFSTCIHVHFKVFYK